MTNKKFLRQEKIFQGRHNIRAKDDENNAYRFGYTVHRRDERYYLRVPGAGHGVSMLTYRIDREAYIGARNETLTIKDILDKFRDNEIDGWDPKTD